MRVTYCPDYVVKLPENHPFPMRKFSAYHEILLTENLIESKDIVAPRPAAWDDLRLVHNESYLRKLATGTLDRHEQRRMGLPWSKTLVRRSRLAVNGTFTAAKMALEDGIAANLAGGTHHAMPTHGEGFCVLNDVAIAVRMLQRMNGAYGIRRALIIDLDVHQGNANAAAFADDDDVYTFSMHGAKNFPMKKPPSSRDVPLDDHMGDTDYLSLLADHLPLAFEEANPDIVFYLAGVDPVIGDRYGRLCLTRDGLRQRERMVLEFILNKGVPTVLLMSGGYAKTPELTADLHATVHRELNNLRG